MGNTNMQVCLQVPANLRFNIPRSAMKHHRNVMHDGLCEVSRRYRENQPPIGITLVFSGYPERNDKVFGLNRMPKVLAFTPAIRRPQIIF